MEVDADAVNVLYVEPEVADNFGGTCNDGVAELVEEEDVVVLAQSEALEFGFGWVESEAEVVDGFAQVDKDGLELVVRGCDNGDVVGIDYDPGPGASVGVFDL